MNGITVLDPGGRAIWHLLAVCGNPPFIYYTEDHAVYADKMEAIFAQVSDNGIHVLTSAVTLSEVLMKPVQANDQVLLKRYDTLFYHTQALTVIAVSVAAGELAARLRARYNLRTPDAIHIASAIDAGCDAFLTNDTGIKRVSEIKVLILDDLQFIDQDMENME